MGRGGHQSNLLYGNIDGSIIGNHSGNSFLGRELGFDYSSFSLAKGDNKEQDIDQLLTEFNSQAPAKISGYHNTLDKARWSGTDKWLIRRNGFMVNKKDNIELSPWQQHFMDQADYENIDIAPATDPVVRLVEEASEIVATLKSSKLGEKVDYRYFMEPVLFNYVNKRNLLNKKAVYYTVDKESQLASEPQAKDKQVDVPALLSVEKGLDPIVGSWYCLNNVLSVSMSKQRADYLFYLSRKGKLLAVVPLYQE
jgi:hypothetical protein